MTSVTRSVRLVWLWEPVVSDMFELDRHLGACFGSYH